MRQTANTKTLFQPHWHTLINRSAVPQWWQRLLDTVKSYPYRPILQFAEEEIWLPPGGPRTRDAPRRFQCDFQPYTRLWFSAIDSHQWTEHVLVAVTQGGKTLAGSTIPLIWMIHERNENMVYGIPDLNMVRAKWVRDLFPVLRASRYADRIPAKGPGSRGGTPNLLEFTHGPSLIAMTGGGSDKARAGWTAPGVAVTEADGFDRMRETSRESSPIEQLKARRLALELRQIGFFECTASVPEGFVWESRTVGTGSEIALPCPHCGEYIVPSGTEKDLSLVTGWKAAENVIQATRGSRWTCWHCGGHWTEQERHEANRRAVLIHRGQTIDRHGNVTGTKPETDTFSLRVTAIHNMFRSAGQLGAELWRYDKMADGPNKLSFLRRIHQFSWALPEFPQEETPMIELHTVMDRIDELAKGEVPPNSACIGAFIDVHKRELFYAAMATVVTGTAYTGYIVDYGTCIVPTDRMGEYRPALMQALGGLLGQLRRGYRIAGSGEFRQLEQVWIDANYAASTETIYDIAREHAHSVSLVDNVPWVRPAFGRMMERRFGTHRYARPVKPTGIHPIIGDHWHFKWVHSARRQPLVVVEVDADHWKSVASERYSRSLDAPGGIRLFAGTSDDHAVWIRHMASEQPELIKGVTRTGTGYIEKWITVARGENHYWDILYNLCALTDYCLAHRVRHGDETDTDFSRRMGRYVGQWR